MLIARLPHGKPDSPNNQPVGLVWLSPDCKHFSKAKGGKPVEKKIRGLAWVTLRWAAKCKPRVIMLENVEEFKTWGPLLIDAEGNAKPDPAKKGKTFDSFVRQLRAHGYDVDWRELRASEFDTPTIRKRFFLVARRDGISIQWPAATNGAPGSIGVQAGKLAPFRTAAECIDWSIPCPSIFERDRPLADATMRRIAKGIMRYVINSGSPFIVPLTHQGSDRVESLDEPMRTTTGAHRGERAFISPTIVPIAHYNGRDTAQDAAAPLSTVTAHPRGGSHALMAATLVQTGYGEREGQAPRALDIEKPLGTVVGGAVKHAQVTAFLAKHYTGVVGSDLDDPIGTVTAIDHHGLVSACLVGVGARAGQSRPRGIEEPIATVTAKYDTAVVSAHITKFRGGAVGSPVDEPLHTVTAGGNPVRDSTGNVMGIVTSNLIKLRGTSNAAATDEPIGTISAQGMHHAEVRAFLLSYYGTDQAPELRDPLATVTSHDRFGLVTIQGQDYQIVDIGLRMLSPRELYRAQGFPEEYIIDRVPDWEKLFVDGQQVADVHSIEWRALTKSAQVRMCGNSVCPPMARALIQANFVHEREIVRVA